MSLKLTDIQKVSLSIAVTDAKGNPAPIDGKPTWASSDANILTVNPSDDGLSAEVLANGPLGNAQVQVSVDADLGEGVSTLSGTLDVEVTGSAATAISIAAGTPENQV